MNSSSLKEYNFPVHLDTEGRVQIGEPAEAQMVVVVDRKSKQIIHGYLEFEGVHVEEMDTTMNNDGAEEVLLPFEEMEEADQRRDLCEIFENPTFNNNNSNGGYSDDDHEW